MAVCFGAFAPIRQRFERRRSFQKGTTNLGLGAAGTRCAGEVRAGIGLKTVGLLQNHLYQNQAIGAKKTTAMMIKTYIVTLSLLGNVT